MIRHILEKYGSSDATLDLLVKELEEHLSEEECEELSKQIYESTQGQHFDECFARKQISKMYYTDSDGRHYAPYWEDSRLCQRYRSCRRLVTASMYLDDP